MITKQHFLIPIIALILTGCGNDATYKKQINGDDNYINSPALKPLKVPEGVDVPKEKGNFYVFKAKTQGEVGNNLDIRPPVYPKLTTIGNSARYANGEMILYSYDAYDWDKIQSALKQLNYAIEDSNKNILTTKPISIERDGSLIGVYEISNANTGTIVFKLLKLERNGQLIENEADVRRYTIEFFNRIMQQLGMNENIQEQDDSVSE